VNSTRRARLWELVVACARGRPVTVEDVCATAVSATGVDGASVTVVLRASPGETIYVSDRIAAEVAELALTLGEGPYADAGTGGPVLASDLADPDCRNRWPVFAPQAAAAGVRALFAFPLQIGGIRFGVLGLHRAAPGDLDRERAADALVLADTVCALLLDGAGLDRPPVEGRPPVQAIARHAVVHQATGMIAVQLGVSVAVALVRLRAHAYTDGRGLDDVAADVVARRLRFRPDTGDAGGRGGP
jgi:GAF domain-containing protein